MSARARARVLAVDSSFSSVVRSFRGIEIQTRCLRVGYDLIFPRASCVVSRLVPGDIPPCPIENEIVDRHMFEDDMFKDRDAVVVVVVVSVVSSYR